MNVHIIGYCTTRTLRRYLSTTSVLWNPYVGVGCCRELPIKCYTDEFQTCKDLFYLNSQNFLVAVCKKRLKIPVRFFSVDQNDILNSKTSLKQACVADNEDQSLEPPSAVGVHGSREKGLEKTAATHCKPVSEFEKVGGDGVAGGQQTREQFYELLYKCASPTDVLDLAGKSNLNSKQLSNCFTVMWETIKKMSDEQRRYEKKLMFEHSMFEQLCVKAMKQAREMHCDDLAYTMLALVKLGVSSQSRLVQMLLKVSQEQLNKFHERALSVLANCLEEMESSKNVDALRAGLRVLIELRITRTRGILPLQTMMRAAGRDASPALKKKLETKAISMLDQFSLPNAQHMFTTLAAINLRSFPVLKACSDKIVENIHGIPFWRLVSVLQACQVLQYRNPELFFAVAEYVASTLCVWQNKQIVTFLSLFEELGFRHMGLLDAFALKVINDPHCLTLKEMLTVLRVYSLLNHLPREHSQRFLKVLNGNIESYLPKLSSVDLLRVTYSFCIFGYFPPVLFSYLLQEDVISELLTPGNQFQDINVRILHSINVCLELDGLSFAKQISQPLIIPTSSSITVNPAVQQALESILGDDGLFHSAVQLPMDYYIDFEIALDKEKKTAIPLCEAESYNQDIQRVAVVCALTSAFCYGTTHPRGRLAMKLRHLTALGFRTVLVPEHLFGRMSEDERVHFLKSKIYGEEQHSEGSVSALADQVLRVK